MKKILLSSLMLFLCSFEAWSGDKTGLRNQRYCEIITSNNPLVLNVYNTIGLNNCPEHLWQGVTEASVKKQTQARFVILNGPRYWTFDAIKSSKLIDPTVLSFNGITMRKAGIIELKIKDLIFRQAYMTHVVKRDTTWVFDAHKPVYELINPEGLVFVMQSYSTEKTPQTEASLPTLGSKLHLPKGWRFRTGTLSHAQSVAAIDQYATVVQDDFLNTYQLATHDLLDDNH